MLFEGSVKIIDALIFLIVLSISMIASWAMSVVELSWRLSGNEVAFSKVPLNPYTFINAFSTLLITKTDGVTS